MCAWGRRSSHMHLDTSRLKPNQNYCVSAITSFYPLWFSFKGFSTPNMTSFCNRSFEFFGILFFVCLFCFALFWTTDHTFLSTPSLRSHGFPCLFLFCVKKWEKGYVTLSSVRPLPDRCSRSRGEDVSNSFCYIQQKQSPRKKKKKGPFSNKQ